MRPNGKKRKEADMFKSLIFAAATALQQDAVPYALIAYGVVAILLVVFFAMGYCKAPPDKAFIISGLRKRVLIGRRYPTRTSST